MEKFWDIINYLLPVYIIDRNDILYIEDRRPTLTMLISGLAALGLLLFTLYLLIKSLRVSPSAIGENPWVFVALGVGTAVAFVFAMRGNFREIYVFDKPRDTYTFTRQSVLKKDVLEGSLSQFRAVRVEERQADESTIYMVSMLMRGLLLGASDVQILRENPPVFNSMATESRIAAAISRFLKIEYVDAVDGL